MTLFKNNYRIETTRLHGWDYSSDGYYFVTICVKDRDHLFGHIAKGEMQLNPYGAIVEQCWFDLPNHYPNIKLDAFCVMPDHVHCIVQIDNNISLEAGFKPASTSFKPASTKTTTKRHGLFECIRAFKTFSARRINELRNSAGKHVWQSRFYDHIIRDQGSLERIREYINRNPKNWHDEASNL
jgi:putative transposase